MGHTCPYGHGNLPSKQARQSQKVTQEEVSEQLWSGRTSVIQDDNQKQRGFILGNGKNKVMIMRCRRFEESLRRGRLLRQFGPVLKVWTL